MDVSYSRWHRPREVDRNEVLTADFRSAAVTFCNRRADALRASGWSDEQIFAEDHSIGIEVFGELQVTFLNASGNGNNEADIVNEEFQVHCKAYEPFRPNVDLDKGALLVERARITSVVMDLDYNAEPQYCPTDVEATAVFFANKPGMFKFRFATATGQVSSPITMNMDASNEQGGQYIAHYQNTFAVGELTDEPFTSGPINPELPEASESDFEVVAGNGLSAEGLGGFVVEAPPEGTHKNSLWIEILDGHEGSIAVSDYARYELFCTRYPGEVNSELDVPDPEWAHELDPGLESEPVREIESPKSRIFISNSK